MAARILDGKAAAARVEADVRAGVQALRARGVEPGLAVVLVGDDPASAVYVRNKERAAARAGIAGCTIRLPAGTRQEALLAEIARLNADPAVHGILLQLPLPAGGDLDGRAALDHVAPAKDVDGLHPDNAGRLTAGRARFVPCTPAGVLRLLDHHDVSLAGRRAVVVGRSPLVGKPMAHLLLGRDATVTVCHSLTPDLAAETRRADVLVVAAGRPRLVTGAMVAGGAVVVDVGIHRLPDAEGGGLCGDVDFGEVAGRASWITPVPGGVGPMTIAMLMHNTVLAATPRVG